MKPRRVGHSNALPSRRELLLALGASGGALVLGVSSAHGLPTAPPSAAPEGRAVVLYPTMGRVVLVFANPIQGNLHVYVDGKEVPAEFVTIDGDAPHGSSPAPSAQPVASTSALPSAPTPDTPIPSGGTRYGVYAEVGKRQVTVSVDGLGTASATADVKLGDSVEVPMHPVEQQLGGAMPIESYSGGCCGGARAQTASAAHATPSLGIAAVAVAILTLRRRGNADR